MEQENNMELTFKQQLVLALAKGSANYDNWYEDYAEYLVEAADKIIELMEKGK